jgi:hypothetical protein
MNISARWAYIAVFVAVCGHASSEFFAALIGISGPEVSVWRFMIGGAGLVLWALCQPGSRNLLAPLRDGGWYLVGITMLGVTLPYLAFHWSLDYASVIQIATFVTTIPLWFGVTNLLVNKQPFTMAKMATGAMGAGRQCAAVDRRRPRCAEGRQPIADRDPADHDLCRARLDLRGADQAHRRLAWRAQHHGGHHDDWRGRPVADRRGRIWHVGRPDDAVLAPGL